MAHVRIAIVAVLCLLVVVAAPFVAYPVFLMKVFYTALFACALNLLLGYVGLLSFGHAAFFGCGAYLAAHALVAWDVGPLQALAISCLSAGLLGAAFGYLAIKRRGIYFSMITLALAQMFYFICLQAPFTHGEDGIQKVPRGDVFGLISLQDTFNIYLFTVTICLIWFFILWRFVRSPVGNILIAIRDNEARAVSLGYNVGLYKLAAFVVSAMAAGCAGGLKAIIFQLATLTDVGWHLSGEVVMMTVIGGIGTVAGPVVGAAFLVSLENVLSSSELPVTVVTGCVFIMTVLLFKRGIVGEIRAAMKRRSPTRALPR